MGREGGVGEEHADRRAVRQQVHQDVGRRRAGQQDHPARLGARQDGGPADHEELHQQRQERPRGQRQEAQEPRQHGRDHPPRVADLPLERDEGQRERARGEEPVMDRVGEHGLDALEPEPRLDGDDGHRGDAGDAADHLHDPGPAGHRLVQREGQRGEHEEEHGAHQGRELVGPADVGAREHVAAEELDRVDAGVLDRLVGVVGVERHRSPGGVGEKQQVGEVEPVVAAHQQLVGQRHDHQQQERAQAGEEQRPGVERHRRDHRQQVDEHREGQLGTDGRGRPGGGRDPPRPDPSREARVGHADLPSCALAGAGLRHVVRARGRSLPSRAPARTVHSPHSPLRAPARAGSLYASGSGRPNTAACGPVGCLECEVSGGEGVRLSPRSRSRRGPRRHRRRPRSRSGPARPGSRARGRDGRA